MSSNDEDHEDFSNPSTPDSSCNEQMDMFQPVSADMEVPEMLENPNSTFDLPAISTGLPERNQPTEMYTVTIRSVDFTLPIYYKDPKYVGHGAFGAVISAQDTRKNRPVAIKKLSRPFQGSLHAQRAYREVKFLIYLNHEDSSTVQLYDLYTPDPDVKNFRSIYLVFKYIPKNLDSIIRRRIHFAEDHIRQIIYSILRGLKYIHSAGIIHRDIKPVNIGIDRNSNVTIFDFGLARTVSDGIVTGYVSTRWWRAPEVSLNWERYNEKLDIWSVGCVMAELVALVPIFQGADSMDQLRKIMRIVGTPPISQLITLCGQHAATELISLGNFPPLDFNEVFGYKYDPQTNKIISGLGEQGVDFLRSLLTFDHRDRPTLAQALNHPFMAQYHDDALEPVKAQLIDEHANGSTYRIEQWKEIIWNLMENYVPPPFLA